MKAWQGRASRGPLNADVRHQNELRSLKLLLISEFLVAFFVPIIGLVVLLGAAPTAIVSLFMFPLDGWLLLTVLLWVFLTLAALFGLWAVWQLLVVQLFPSVRVAHPRALYVCILLGLIALSIAVYFALDQPWFVLAGLLLPVPATLHLLALYRSRHWRKEASDV